MDFAEICTILGNRQREQSVPVRQMLEVRNRYNGDWVVPLPDVENNPVLPQLTPSIIGEAIDDTARRFCQTRGRSSFPALDPTRHRGVRSEEYAAIRRKIVAATYHRSSFLLARQRYARHLAAYATCSLMVWPDDSGYPCIEVRDPLGTFADPRAPENVSPPLDCGFIYEMSAGQVRRTFPVVRSENGGPVTAGESEELWQLCEWLDEDHLVVGLMGPKYLDASRSYDARGAGVPWKEMARTPNLIGYAPVIIPRKVSLDRLASSVANMIGATDLMAKLMALDIIAQEKAIFTDRYIIGRAGAFPTVVGGDWKDGRTGQANLLQDVEAVGELRSTPDLRTQQMVDKLERNVKTSIGLMPQVGGETYGALRTGRGIDSLMGVAVDGRIRELHELDQSFLPTLNRMILDSYKAYWPDRTFTMYSGWPGDKGHVKFTPEVHIESTENSVDYVIPGADIGQTTMWLTQMLVAGAISLETFRSKHPLIEAEEDERILTEVGAMRRALSTSIEQALTAGQMPKIYGSVIIQSLVDGDQIEVAAAKADIAVREWQARQAPPPGPDQLAAPQQMPGLEGMAVPGGGMPPEAMAGAPPTMPPPSEGFQNQRSALAAISAGMGR